MMLVGLAGCGEVATPSDDGTTDADQSAIDAASVDATALPPDSAWPPAVTVEVLAPDEINANCPGGEFVLTFAGPPAAAIELAIELPDGGSVAPSLDGPHVLDAAGHLSLTTYPSSATPTSMTMDAQVTDAYDRITTGSDVAFVYAKGPVCLPK